MVFICFDFSFFFHVPVACSKLTICLGFRSFFQAFYYQIFGVPKKDLNGEIALVTGGGGGLGRLLALRLIKLGAKVVLWDINQEGMYTTK